PAMAIRLADETGREPADVALAFLAAAEAFDLSGLWQEIGLLDGKVGGGSQLDLYARVRDFHLEQTASLLHQGMDEGLVKTVSVLRAAAVELTAALPSAATPRQLALENEHRRELEGLGAPPPLAARIARLELLGHAPAITWLAQATGRELA